MAPEASRPRDRPVLLLWGFMGSGKSTLGRLVADRANVHFCDLDDAIVESAGMSIVDIFRTKGEAHFRELERAALRGRLEGSSQPRRQLIALGGGALLDQSLRSDGLRLGFVVSLTATAATIAARTAGSNRPLLQTDHPEQTIRRLLAERQAAYQSAHLLMRTDDEPIDELAERLLARWQGWRVG